MEAFYFGESKSLFGVYHAPYAARDRRSGVVICNPLGQEYIRSHRSLRQLAVKLADFGFHVLRFDFFGTGDSAGELEAGNVQHWVQDIAAAVEELKDYSDIQQISMIGLRLGAALSVLCNDAANTIERAVLWDPVVDGEMYLQEVTTFHQQWLKDLLPKPPEEIAYSEQLEILGFPFSKSMYNSIKNIDLLNVEAKPANRILLIESDAVEANNRLKMRFESQGASCTLQHVPNSKVWRKGEELNSVLMPNETLNAIINWIGSS